ncbi:TIGR01906 family membrane protein [Streptococcus sp. DD12]|uniref:TIGR01906 family membrane protein n=1 Tax=Streptococcus sp. DD12 TaxID=1777880 RepID=UPI0009E79E3D
MKWRLQWASLYLWLLSLAIFMTIILAWGIYPLEIRWQALEKTVYLSGRTIAYNFNRLMAYLTLPWVTTFDLPAFSSSASGRHHFLVVKWLFHLVEALVFLLAYPACRFLGQVMKHRALALFKRPLVLAITLPIVLAIGAVLIGFDQFFTLFHQLLFVGDDSWLFDPLKDPVILILPEDYFLHAFVLFFGLYESLFLCLYVIALCQNGHRDDTKAPKMTKYEKR